MRHYLRTSRARRPYVCDVCGTPIPIRQPYFRDEPHPMARRHRGAEVRYLCTVCVTGQPPSTFSEQARPGQLRLHFAEALANLPSAMIQTAVVQLGATTDEGILVEGVTLPWLEMVLLMERDPRFLYEVPWQKLEELIAGAYEREGWDEVTITPRSADGGRDIIAVRRGACAIRIIDQVKAYSPGHKVTANDVRALLGVLSSDRNVSKGFVTTTAKFAPRIREDATIAPFLPYRLQLRSGVQLRSWLVGVARQRESRG